jgi:hypothetical protein
MVHVIEYPIVPRFPNGHENDDFHEERNSYIPSDAIDYLEDRPCYGQCDAKRGPACLRKIASKKEVSTGFKSLKDAQITGVGVQMHTLALKNISRAKSVNQ